MSYIDPATGVVSGRGTAGYGDDDTFVAEPYKKELHPKTYLLWAGIGLIAFLAYRKFKK